MTLPARHREVTADGMTRVAAVVASMVESSRVADADGPLSDLIAKAAQVVENHATTTRILRTRGVAQQSRANESLRVANGGAVAAVVHKLDVTR